MNGWGFSIEKQNIQKHGDKLMFPTIGEVKYYGTKQLHKMIPDSRPLMDCKVQKNSFGEYFLIVPYKCHQKRDIPKISTNPVAVDPGVRKFLTTYAPNAKESMLMGNRWATNITGLLIKLDNMISLSSNEKNMKIKKSLMYKIKRMRKRVFNMKKEMRDQCANFLSKKYDAVLIPKLDVKSLSIKSNRKLKTKTVRNMMNACHGMMFDALKHKCWENGSKFLHVREEYTSQTCPNCGSLNKCNEVYTCKHCGFKHDRDIVGALNILLKAVRTTNPCL
jgi:putative transposase